MSRGVQPAASRLAPASSTLLCRAGTAREIPGGQHDCPRATAWALFKRGRSSLILAPTRRGASEGLAEAAAYRVRFGRDGASEERLPGKWPPPLTLRPPGAVAGSALREFDRDCLKRGKLSPYRLDDKWQGDNFIGKCVVVKRTQRLTPRTLYELDAVGMIRMQVTPGL